MRRRSFRLTALLGGLLVIGCSGSTTPDAGLATGEEKAAAPAPPITSGKGQDWTMLGGSPQREQANIADKDVPEEWSVEKGSAKNLKWEAQLGSYSYAGPVVAGGRVFIGTNNDKPRDPAIKGDKGILLCLREADGTFLWQAVFDKLPKPMENDWPQSGVASTPVVEGDRVYFVNNRCELICADAAGKPGTHEANLLWALDMVKELKVYPCFLANCSPLVVGDLVFVVTGNGVETQEFTVPVPEAPSFVAVNKKTGKVAWTDNSPGKNIMEGQWGSPAYAEVAGKGQVIFPGGDGWLRAFEPKTGKLLWKFNCNPRNSVFKPGGRGTKSYLVATPVVYDNKVYIGVGQNPEAGGSTGVGHFWCIDLTREPANPDKDLSPVEDNFDPKDPKNKDSGLVWHYGGMVVPKPKDPRARDYYFGRTIATAAAHDGLVFITELEGYLHCFDAKTGQHYWAHDFKVNCWSSPLWVDGKVYVGNEDGDVKIFRADKTYHEPKGSSVDQAIKGPVVVANGTLYLMTATNLYAIGKK